MVESNPDRDPFELLAAEFTDRCRRGERPSIDDYAQRHPELAEEIRELFPTIAVLEQAKSVSPGQTGGGPVRGGVKLERLGDFRIIRELGRGGMGIVYEAEQESLGRRVALKVLPQQLLLDPEQLQRFEHEARTAAGLHHTNIVPIFGVGAYEGYHYIVMQYIRGVGLDVVLRELRRMSKSGGTEAASTLAMAESPSGHTAIDALSVARSLALDFSRRSARVNIAAQPPTADSTAAQDSEHAGSNHDQQEDQPASTVKASRDTTGNPRLGPTYWQSVARLALQIAEALDHAHTQGTLHRDIKPGNLLVDADGTVWVADFGLAKALDRDGTSQTGGVVGTLRYMAPEQFAGTADARSDIYSLGLTLYELATLRPAFAETSRTMLVSAMTRETPRAPRQLCPTMPRDLETIILKSIAREPNGRYASAAALAADLRRFLEDRPILARRASLPEQLWRWSRRNPALATLSGTAAVLLIAVAAIATGAYEHTRRANVQVRNALAGEQTQRAKAEATSKLAIEALDTIFDQFAPARTGVATTIIVDGSAGTQFEVPIEPVLSPETATLLEHMLGFYGRLATQEGADPTIRLKIAEANRRVGDIHCRLGHAEEAKAAYTQAAELFEQIEANTGATPTTRVELARVHNELGSILLTQERDQQGRASLQKARAILEALQPTPSDSPAACFELARACFLLAKPSRPPIPTPPRREPSVNPPPDRPPRPEIPGPAGPAREPPDATPQPAEDDGERSVARQKAIDLLTELGASYPEVPEYRRLLALCYRDLPAPRLRGPDDQRGARDAMTHAIAILKQLVDDYPTGAEYRYDLSETYAMAAVPALCVGTNPLAMEEQRLRDALKISEQLVAERPNIPTYAISQVHIRLRFADFLRRRNQTDAAEDQLKHAESLQVGLAQRFPKIPSNQVFVAVVEGALGRLLRDRGQLNEARSHLEVAAAVLDKLPGDWPRPPYVRDVFVATFTDLADVDRRLGDHAAASEAARRVDENRTDR
ncbi:MAG TPA: serine/threonine-protein kinase [Phycisphaerae bacterium]|nr:serine/threonine-protein kinase [Phycisphaerae bacterium]HNU44781.1 serine/threonine-protein kinase [Phycisphaerae bacterium]